MKISSSKLIQWSAIIAGCYFYFYSQLMTAIGGKYCYPVLGLCAIFSVAALMLKKRMHKNDLQWAWAVILVISTITNQGLQRRAWLWPVTFVMLILLLFALTTNTSWHETAVKILLAGSLIYCAATILFFVAPGLYAAMVQFWKGYPNGTERGLYGYRAGIADNHSANGTYCLVSFIIASANYFLEKEKKKKRLYLGIAGVGMFCVLLTTKRAHLLFGIFAAMVCYYFSQKQKKASRLFQILFVVVAGLILFYYAATSIPVLSDFMEGFEGQEDLSNGRYKYWTVALSYFVSSPVFGIGWLGFRYRTQGILAKGYVDVHNVYIQLLAESGVVGTAIMMVIFAGTLAETIRMLQQGDGSDSPGRRALCMSLGMQVFCLVYGVTGNFLYDRTCFIYIFGCALCYSVKHSKSMHQKDPFYD